MCRGWRVGGASVGEGGRGGWRLVGLLLRVELRVQLRVAERLAQALGERLHSEPDLFAGGEAGDFGSEQLSRWGGGGDNRKQYKERFKKVQKKVPNKEKKRSGGDFGGEQLSRLEGGGTPGNSTRSGSKRWKKRCKTKKKKGKNSQAATSAVSSSRAGGGGDNKEAHQKRMPVNVPGRMGSVACVGKHGKCVSGRNRTKKKEFDF